MVHVQRVRLMHLGRTGRANCRIIIQLMIQMIILLHPICFRTEARAIKWLSPGDPAHTVLTNWLNKPATTRNLRLLAHGIHTSQLENLHSLILKYAPKRLDFDPPAYDGRVRLAILDHNENVARKAQIGEKALSAEHGSFHVPLACVTTQLATLWPDSSQWPHLYHPHV